MKILLTGANGQLGQAFANSLNTDKNELYLVDIVSELHNKEILNSKNVSYLSLDITDQLAVDNACNEIGDIDILINNAGVGVFSDFLSRTIDELNYVTQINLIAPIYLTKKFLPGMVKRGFGNIVNVGSVYGVVSSDYRIYGESGRNNSEIYSSTKAGIIQFTKYVAANYGHHGIISNAISPGGVFNNQLESFVENYINKTPTGRMAKVEDIVAALNFLISEGSNYVNGHNLIVDGGFSSW